MLHVVKVYPSSSQVGSNTLTSFSCWALKMYNSLLFETQNTTFIYIAPLGTVKYPLDKYSWYVSAGANVLVIP